MFATIAASVFRFLESEHGFTRHSENQNSIFYERGGVFIRLSYSIYREVSLSVGKFSHGMGNGFSAGLLLDLESSSTTLRTARNDRFATKEEMIEPALREHEYTLRNYGKRVLSCDLTVFDDLQKRVDLNRMERNDAPIRERAQIAFAKRDYIAAYKLYKQLQIVKPIDSKRIEICLRHQ